MATVVDPAYASPMLETDHSNQPAPTLDQGRLPVILRWPLIALLLAATNIRIVFAVILSAWVTITLGIDGDKIDRVVAAARSEAEVRGVLNKASPPTER